MCVDLGDPAAGGGQHLQHDPDADFLPADSREPGGGRGTGRMPGLRDAVPDCAAAEPGQPDDHRHVLRRGPLEQLFHRGAVSE